MIKLTEITQKCIPYLIVLSFFVLFLDTLKYPGFVGNKLFIDAKVYPALALTFLFIFKRETTKLIKNINLIVLVFSTFSYLFFSYLEAANYVNYVLATYKISLEGFIYIPLFSAFLLILEKKEVKNLFNLKPDFWQIILPFFVIYALFVNIGKSLNQAVNSNLYVASHLAETYDEKMQYQWGDFYEYMVFVKENTPEDADIVIPPHVAPWWNRSGDLNLVMSFLYPRSLIQYGTEEIPDVDALPKGSYILVAWGEWNCEVEGMCRGWPTQKLKVSKFIIKSSDSTQVKEIREDVTYDPADTSNPYGLIKL